MQEPSQPSTANIAVACAIVAGVTGYMLGQAKSLGLFGGSPLSASAQRDEKAAEDSDESSGEDSGEDSDEDDTAPADFKGSNEECKLVLVVRTDLGMTKGTAHSSRLRRRPLTARRQNRRTVRTRDTGLLQALPPHRARLARTEALGAAGPGQGGAAGQERGGARAAAGTGAEPRTGSPHHPRRGTDTDCERERNGAGHWACAEERHRPGHGALEAVVDME
jgi:hypothetical protein